MESDLNQLLNTDIEAAKTTLQNVLMEMSMSTPTAALLEDGLCAAHTLKALAAVKGIAHLEQYAAQLEQLFSTVRQNPPQEIIKHINTNLRAIEREFREACRLASQENRPQVTNKLASLVQDLYTLDRQLSQKRYEAHMQELSPVEVSVEQLFRSFVPWLQRAAEATQKQVQTDIHIPQPIVLPTSSIAPLQTVLVHLLRNAVFHGIEPPSIRRQLDKPPRGTIQMSAEIADDMLILSVSDDGCGMSQADHQPDPVHAPLKLLFGEETAGSADSTVVETSIYAVSNAQTGLGVGLHIVKTHVQKLQGQFEIRSIARVGTCAIMHLPLAVFRE